MNEYISISIGPSRQTTAMEIAEKKFLPNGFSIFSDKQKNLYAIGPIEKIRNLPFSLEHTQTKIITYFPENLSLIQSSSGSEFHETTKNIK